MALINQVITDRYALYNGDCVEVVSGLPSNSVGMVVYSPPFCGLYNYSSDDRDMSNNATYDQFYAHYEFLVRQLARVTKPGRINAVHCMDIPQPGQKDGYHDLPGRLIALHEKHGFRFNGRVCIWKEPLAVAIRTRLKHLQHKALVKDSSGATIAAADYLLIFQRAGENEVPITHEGGGIKEYYGAEQIPEELWQYRDEPEQSKNRFSHWIWRRYASSVWMDIRTANAVPCGDGRTCKAVLSYKEARDPEDEKHVHPLQLDVIHRAVQLWSNPGETVLTPFMGVGSEVYGPVYQGRRGIGVELKKSYFRQAVRNLAEVDTDRNADMVGGLFQNMRAPEPETSTPLAEYRALVEQGPAVVMASKDDFLALLDKASAA
jgi:DNA modification methylase